MRLIRSTDREQLAQWIADDPEHKDLFLPEFWYERNRVSFVIEDKSGPVMFVKLVPEPPAMRIYIQFCHDPSRVAKAMLRHFSEVKVMVRRTGAKMIVFDTNNSRLAASCERLFGFQRITESDYSLHI